MATTSFDGPLIVSGSTGTILAAIFGSAVGDPNPDAGPSNFFQGTALLDPRYFFNKDMATGFAGKAPGHFNLQTLLTCNTIPMTVSATNICAAQGVTSGVPMTLAAANAAGITLNVPIIPFTQAGINQGAPVTTAIALDFGFEFGTVVSGNSTITVASSLDFFVGMPLVISGAGNAAGTMPLLTNVATLGNGTTTITITGTPLSSVTNAAIGTGNFWGPSPTSSSTAFVVPNAALPWLGAGPNLLPDHRQTLTRGLQFVGVSGGTGGTITVKGWDIYGVPMSQTVTLAAGSNTVYSTKAFKYIGTVTPNFTDTTHNVTVGTSDTFGFNYRTPMWETATVSWAGAFMTSSTGFVAPTSLITVSSATTGDVRGTIQTDNANGPVTGIGTTASNGTISGLALSGNRLYMAQDVSALLNISSNQAAFSQLFGVTQA